MFTLSPAESGGAAAPTSPQQPHQAYGAAPTTAASAWRHIKHHCLNVPGLPGLQAVKQIAAIMCLVCVQHHVWRQLLQELTYGQPPQLLCQLMLESACFTSCCATCFWCVGRSLWASTARPAAEGQGQQGDCTAVQLHICMCSFGSALASSHTLRCKSSITQAATGHHWIQARGLHGPGMAARSLLCPKLCLFPLTHWCCCLAPVRCRSRLPAWKMMMTWQRHAAAG
jgi:hypothetical protein